jgi:23S rRNA pseudouridine1911/1915/1917 synthase
LALRYYHANSKLAEPIRFAHLKHIGHPLFNDERYGGHLILKGTTFTKYKQFIDNCFKILPRPLHAKTFGFVHPTTAEMMRFDTNFRRI